MNTHTLAATAATSVSDGVTTTANGATIVIGGAAPNKHALLRFDSSGIAADENIMSATLSVVLTALGVGTPPDVDLWAAAFGTSVNNASYNHAISDSHQQITDSSNPFVPHNGTLTNSYSYPVPTRFITAVGNSDFELIPSTATTGATDTLTIAGAAGGGNAPSLVVLTLTDAELSNSNPFRFQAIGAETFCAFAQETNEGVAVKPCNILDAYQVGLTQTAANLRGDGLSSNRVRFRKAAVGRTGAGGPVSFDVTPEKWTALLPGVLKKVSTTGPVDDQYTHTFKVGASNTVASFTFVTKKGAFRQVYPGCKISRMQLSIGLDSIVKATIDVQALDEYKYDYASTGLNDEILLDPAAGYDSVQNGLWSFVETAVSVGGDDGRFVQSFMLDLVNDIRERRGLNGSRGPNSHYPLGFAATTQFSMHFENEMVLKKFFGVQARGFPWKPGKQLMFENISCTLLKIDASHTLSLVFPRAIYETVSDPIQGEDSIILNVVAEGVYDESSLGNFTLTLTTPEPATVFQPSTNLITVLPPA